MPDRTTIKNFCATCGTQFPPLEALPELCPICDDDRQYINPNGQTWLSYDDITKNHEVKITKINEGFYTLKITPNFAIAQRAFLIISPNGNILWDCIPLLNREVIDFVNSIGGLKAIAFSHPHYFSNMNNWAEIFNCDVYINQLDEPWVAYKSSWIKLWQGEVVPIWDGISINHIGGHFPGSCVLRLPSDTGATILGGDTFYIAPSKRHIAVMYSYPNQILLSKTEFISVYEKSANLDFDTMYGAFEHQNLVGNAKTVFDNSMKLYIDNYNA